MLKFYTGVGNCETPKDMLDLIKDVAYFLHTKGWTLRSGHALGADEAFELGAHTASVETQTVCNSQIFLPWKGFGTEPYKEDPGRPVLGCSICLPKEELILNYKFLVDLKVRARSVQAEAVQLLHGRNYNQVVGLPDQDPSKFLIAYAPVVNGEPQGGTATAIKLAQVLKIPVFNLFIQEDLKKIQEKLK